MNTVWIMKQDMIYRVYWTSEAFTSLTELQALFLVPLEVFSKLAPLHFLRARPTILL